MDNPIDAFVYITPPATSPSYGSIIVGYIDTEQDANNFNDYQITSSTFLLPTPFGILNAVQTLVSDYHHGSTGSVTLKSRDPLMDPIISANFYVNHPERKARFLNTLKQTREALLGFNAIVNASYFTQISPTTDVLPLDATDLQWNTYIESNNGYGPDWHWTGSTSMHKVVDERLRLVDETGSVVPGIRIVGNGVVPNCIRSHSTSSFSMFIGQVASRMILEDNE